jgi:arginine decarboxylase
MRIPVASAVGYGPTELAAFDAALVAAGVADRNLLCLSSVLPPGAVVDQVDTIDNCPGGWGDRLYVVLAEARTSTPGELSCAGIGWVQDDTGRGLLVEHHAGTDTELEKLINTSLDALILNRGMLNLPRRGLQTVSVRCVTDPVCALAVAVFSAHSWPATGAGRESMKENG